MRVHEEPTHRQLLALTHAALDLEPLLLNDEGELQERVKTACARNAWRYDSSTVARAVDAVVFVRRNRRQR